MGRSGKDKGFWGGLFDFDGDGKTSMSEAFLAYKIFEECTKEEQDTSIDPDFDPDTGLSWRDFCEDGFQYGLSPYDFETEFDYEEALQEAKYGWRKTCEDGLEFNVDPDDYETEEEYDEALHEAKYGWRDTCEDGLEFGVDPEDYETEDEYDEALHEAKYGWRDVCESGLEYGIDPDDYETEDEYNEALSVARAATASPLHTDEPEDEPDCIDPKNYPNKRRYQAACALADLNICGCYSDYDKQQKMRCEFILERADDLLAANYLACDSGFLYSQAIKDHFSLPCSLPDEDESCQMELSEVLGKIAKRDIQLSFEIWSWCLEQFLPYADYTDESAWELTGAVLGSLYSFPDKIEIPLVGYMERNPSFLETVMSGCKEPPDSLPELIVCAIQEKHSLTAEFLFKSGLQQADDDWKAINGLVNDIIEWCKNYSELETMEYFRDNLFPLVKNIDHGMVQDEITEWEREILGYIDQVETECEKYAYSRKNSWRKDAPDGAEYGLDPLEYDSLDAYLDALHEEKYRWRAYAKRQETYGLDPNDFETEDAFESALSEKQEAERQKQMAKIREDRARMRAELQAKHLESEAAFRAAMEDDAVYTYCGVVLENTSRVYAYRTDDTAIEIGDTVIVPVGPDNQETQGTVVYVGRYKRIAAPFPVEKTKFILRKMEQNPGDHNGK